MQINTVHTARSAYNSHIWSHFVMIKSNQSYLLWILNKLYNIVLKWCKAFHLLWSTSHQTQHIRTMLVYVGLPSTTLAQYYVNWYTKLEWTFWSPAVWLWTLTSICSPHKWADTAFWLCRAAQPDNGNRHCLSVCLSVTPSVTHSRGEHGLSVSVVGRLSARRQRRHRAGNTTCDP